MLYRGAGPRAPRVQRQCPGGGRKRVHPQQRRGALPKHLPARRTAARCFVRHIGPHIQGWARMVHEMTAAAA
jgi:hypothetical protein